MEQLALKGLSRVDLIHLSLVITRHQCVSREEFDGGLQRGRLNRRLARCYLIGSDNSRDQIHKLAARWR